MCISLSQLLHTQCSIHPRAFNAIHWIGLWMENCKWNWYQIILRKIALPMHKPKRRKQVAQRSQYFYVQSLSYLTFEGNDCSVEEWSHVMHVVLTQIQFTPRVRRKYELKRRKYEWMWKLFWLWISLCTRHSFGSRGQGWVAVMMVSCTFSYPLNIFY